ncbi:glyoxalase [Paenibacillus sp. FSL R7-0273]|uniref:VOC family protein n=1 Tax=Paenibacillus sp. FSL R7-0273 TaxID=1536772 RepID=UPI0004F88979|nr:VOC family protein [Paenibacillus sp. FSL R7-0273]AIQ46711.1 glyoxalase [Paenibacillus sp. FSL R7-0273]OMF97520.1 glyoxalase [Paenibacillus sp. FSL R7-0273]
MTAKAVLHESTQIGLVQIRVSDLERSLAFYQNVIGLQVLRRQGREAVMTADGRQALLVLREIERPQLLSRKGAGLYHFAILLPDRPNLGLVLRNLIAADIEIGQGDHLVSEALYIQDPDNNGIELYRDRPRDTWQRDSAGDVVMTTDPVDVDGLLAASEGLAWEGLPAGTIIGHVHFHVGDLAEAKKFYVDALGFEPTTQYGSSALFISAGGYHHHMGLNVWAGQGAPATPANAPGIDYFTLQLPDVHEITTVAERVRAAGYPVTETADGVILTDPWNIGIHLTVQHQKN